MNALTQKVRMGISSVGLTKFTRPLVAKDDQHIATRDTCNRRGCSASGAEVELHVKYAESAAFGHKVVCKSYQTGVPPGTVKELHQLVNGSLSNVHHSFRLDSFQRQL